MITTISSRELNQDLAKAKRDALSGPVIITDRGEPAHVLMSIAEYRSLVGGPRSVVDALAAPETADIEFDPQPISMGLNPADLS